MAWTDEARRAATRSMQAKAGNRKLTGPLRDMKRSLRNVIEPITGSAKGVHAVSLSALKWTLQTAKMRSGNLKRQSIGFVFSKRKS